MSDFANDLDNRPDDLPEELAEWPVERYEALRGFVLGFLVKHRCTPSAGALRSFASYLEFKDVLPSAPTLMWMLEHCRVLVQDGETKVFACRGHFCGPFHVDGMCDDAIERWKEHHDAEVVFTNCQGGCSFAPRATLRKGNRYSSLDFDISSQASYHRGS